jgi:hypothetical protein
MILGFLIGDPAWGEWTVSGKVPKKFRKVPHVHGFDALA